MKERHKEAAHTDKIIYCSFYNNYEECPYGDTNCMFVHEDSIECKFGKACERKKCMYKHAIEDENEDESGDEPDDERNDNEKIFFKSISI